MRRQLNMFRERSGHRSRRRANVFPTAACERLEDRIVLTLNLAALATGLASESTSLGQVVSARVNESQAALPVLGQSISSLSNDVSRLLDGNRGMLNSLRDAGDRLARANPQTVDAIRSAVYQKLINVLGDTARDGVIDDRDVIVTADPAAGNLAITVSLKSSVDVNSSALNFGLGLSGIPFKVTGRARLNVSASATHDGLTFGLRNNVFFAESPGGVGNFRISVAASLPNSSFAATLGFFQVKVDPRVGGAGVVVNAAIEFDANGLRLTTPRLAGNATADLQLQATLLKSGQDGGRIGVPNFNANLYLDWRLHGAHNAGTDSLGQSPTLELRNVEFGMGTYLSGILKPITDNLYRALEPLMPVFDLLDDPIPGLSDLTEAAGLGEASLESIIKFATPLLSPDLQLVANAVTTLVDVGQAVGRINSDPNGSEIFVNVGSLSISNTNSDLRGLSAVDYSSLGNVQFTKLSDLVVPAQNGLQSVRQAIDSLNTPIGPLLREQFDRIDREILKLENGAGYELPVIEDPSILLRLLLGEDVDLITFKAVFHADASVTRRIPMWGPLDVRLNGTIGFDGYFRAAYDTYGLRQFLDQLVNHNNRDLALLGNGFYLDSSRELIKFRGSISGGGEFSAPIGTAFIGPVPVPIFAFASINGSLRVQGENGGDSLTVQLVDNNPNNGANKVRVFESGELGSSLFRVQGELAADLNFVVEVGPVVGPNIKLMEVGLTSPYVLLTTADLNTNNPYDVLSGVPNEIPEDFVLDMLFDPDGQDDDDDTIVIYREFNQNGTPFISIAVNGIRRETRREDLVLSVIVNGTNTDDHFTVYGIPRPVVLDGRGGVLNSLAFIDRDRPAQRRVLDYLVTDHIIQVGSASRPDSLVNYSGISSVDVQMGNSPRPNRIAIPGISIPTTVRGGTSTDRFVIGDAEHGLFWMGGFLRIFGGGGLDTIEFDDRATLGSADVTIGWRLDRYNTRFGEIGFVNRRGLRWSSVATLPAPDGSFVRVVTPIEREMIFSDIDNVVFRGSPNQNVVTIQDSYPVGSLPAERVPTRMEVIAGLGNDEVQVHSNTGSVVIKGGGGDDVVALGDPIVGTEGLLGSDIRFSNPGGTVTLAVDNSASMVSRNISLRMAGDEGSIDGFGPTVQFDATQLVGLEIRAGQGNDRIDIYDTPFNVTLNPIRILQTRVLPGAGVNEVFVHRATGPLTVESTEYFDVVTVGTSLAPDRRKAVYGLDRINAAVSVVGATLLVDDRLGKSARQFTLNETSLNTAGLGTISFSSLVTLDVQASSRGNRFTVKGAPAARAFLNDPQISTGNGNDVVTVQSLNNPLHIELGGGSSDAVNFGGSGLSLDAIQNGVFITGSAPFSSVFIDDSANTEPRDVVIDRRGVAWNGYQYINFYFGFSEFRPDQFDFVGGSGDDQIFVQGDPNRGDARLYPGPGDDYVFFNTVESRLSNLGNYEVFDSVGIDTLFLNDSGETAAQTYSIDRAAFNRVATTGTQVTFDDNIELVAVTGGSGNNAYMARSFPAATTVELIGGTGREQLQGPDANSVWEIVDDVGRHALINPATPDIGIAFSGIEDLQGGSADDVFVFEPDAVPIAGNIDGGEGANTVDYSRFVDNVFVNLQTESADFIGGTVRSITTVIGGAGNDILVGLGGNNLFGGAGRDLLIAGFSSSQLYGESGEDVLIGGTTDYDADRIALAAIRDFWSRDDLTFAERADAMESGNGVPALNADTVSSNGGGNLLNGGSDPNELDLYFSALGG